MKDRGLSDKERALLQSARREVAAKVKRQEVVDTAGLAGSSAHRGSTSARNLMEAERREAAEKRAKTRRIAIVFFTCFVVVVVIAVARALIR